jgi:SAM-dependent methyltransferase
MYVRYFNGRQKVGEGTKYLAKDRFQLEGEAARRRMTPGISGSKVSIWAIEQTLVLAGGGPILDLACGNGRHLPPLIAANPHVFAGDISYPMLKVAHGLLASTPKDRRLIRLDAEKLPFPDHSFEVVLSARFFHHLPTRSLRASILSEAFRVSRKAVVITYKTYLSWEHLARKVKSHLRGKGGSLEHYYFWPQEIGGIAREEGWRVTGQFASQPFLGANRVLVMEPLEARAAAPLRSTDSKAGSIPPLELTAR